MPASARRIEDIAQSLDMPAAAVRELLTEIDGWSDSDYIALDDCYRLLRMARQRHLVSAAQARAGFVARTNPTRSARENYQGESEYPQHSDETVSDPEPIVVSFEEAWEDECRARGWSQGPPDTGDLDEASGEPTVVSFEEAWEEECRALGWDFSSADGTNVRDL